MFSFDKIVLNANVDDRVRDRDHHRGYDCDYVKMKSCFSSLFLSHDKFDPIGIYISFNLRETTERERTSTPSLYDVDVL